LNARELMTEMYRAGLCFSDTSRYLFRAAIGTCFNLDMDARDCPGSNPATGPDGALAPGTRCTGGRTGLAAASGQTHDTGL